MFKTNFSKASIHDKMDKKRFSNNTILQKKHFLRIKFDRFEKRYF